ncbi:DHA2 family efflux MFS transporter permease subunit [Leisingera aquaemixtae]|uniref:DHA2 family efflux MFS transporter permease subunit n=1 Tax=Leisingera aquaemixtae TaxID=1396826 RepID=UPI0021A7BE74|nr:DHA2 family efflux MFS transporter permease subunit [Leisingera aquaemixtae]UWQ36902.1 DHA2 family efflux MFS transporter permease subunit [Leisingera aquaemixtae]
MDAVNGTIFTIARPQIMGDFNATPDEVSWVNLSYLMAKLACLPAAAWVVGRFGEVQTFFWSMALVAAASASCALMIDLVPFVAARVLQGAAGAGLLVVAQTMLFRLFPNSKQGLVQALYALGVVVAPTSLAPAVQGWLTDGFSWTLIFWLNLGLAPIVLFCVVPFKGLLPDTRATKLPFDWIGFGWFAVAMGAIVYVLLEGSRWNWFDDGRITAWALIGAAALALATSRLIFSKSRSGFFDRLVFTDPHFAFGFFVSFVAGFALFGSAFLIPVFALNVLSMPPMDAGLLLLPSSLAVGAGLLIAGGLITAKSLNPLKFVPFGIALVVSGMWMLSGASLESGAHDLWSGLLVRGLGLGFLFLAVTLITLNGLKPAHVASAVGLFNFGRQMGGIVGISFLTTYLDRQIALNRRILIENITPSSLPFQERHSALATALTDRGLDPGLANEGAAALIQNSIQAQVAVLSFNQAFFSLVMLFVIAVPLILTFKLAQKFTGWSR